MAWTPIVGKGFAPADFKAYVNSLSFISWQPKFVVVHNTSAPTLALYREWQGRKDWTGEQWLRNLESYYIGLGWKAGPHLFVAPDKIWCFTSLAKPGTHTPSWNSISWGVETVGEFEREPFDGAIRDNLITALAVLHLRIGLNPADYRIGATGLHFHKEDVRTDHRTCPGHNMVKADLVADVVARIGEMSGTNGHLDIPISVHEAPSSTLSREELASVKWLQNALNKLGAAPPLAVDDDVGPKTMAAVRAFQQAHPPLVVDGIAGPLTRLAIKAALP